MSFSEFFNHFTEYYGMGNSLLFRRIPLSQLAYFQFPVISNKEKFVLALVINIILIFPVIYFYDDNPLFSTLKNTSVFCFHGAKCSQAKEKTFFSLGSLFPTPGHTERDDSPPPALLIDHKYVVLCTKPK